VLTYERDVGSETNAEGGRRAFKATNIGSSGCKRVVLTYERDVGSETNAEGRRRTFKATKIRISGCESVVLTKKLKFDFCKITKKPRLLTLMTSSKTSKENTMQ
ncbi:hypothetical protein AVEN_108469-1, partial [Araneus ventricosus]